MKIRSTCLTAVLFLLMLNSASGQTAADLTKSYGKASEAYAVSQHIWMTPEYTAGGEVCKMRLFPKRFAAETNYISNRLSFAELKEVLNQIVPLEARGAKKESFGITATGGGAAWTTYPYDLVTFVFISSFRVDPTPGPTLKPYVFSEGVANYESPQVVNTIPQTDDFINSQVFKNEIVTIRWNDRKCVSH